MQTDMFVISHTLSPTHRMVPTSSCASGDKSLPIDSVFPVFDPGLSADLPLKISTRTSFPARRAAPTSMPASAGWPRRMAELSALGMNRTRPVACVRNIQGCCFCVCLEYLRLNEAAAILNCIGSVVFVSWMNWSQAVCCYRRSTESLSLLDLSRQ